MYANIPPHLYYMLKKVKVQGACDSIIVPSCTPPPQSKLSLACFNKFGAPLWAQLLKILISLALMAPSEPWELAIHYIVLPSTDSRHLPDPWVYRGKGPRLRKPAIFQFLK